MKSHISKMLTGMLFIAAIFIALQSFWQKEKLPTKFDSPQWFIYSASGTDETDPSQYILDEDYDPEASGCGGSNIMCAVLAQNNGQGEPVLDVSGSTVVTGSNVAQIKRHN